MALDEKRLREYSRRLLLSRMRLLCDHGFYGLLLMHMRYAMDETLETAATDGACIAFGPAFLESLSDRELDLVMMHEILHLALRHCFRAAGKDPERFNIACDIVVNSNILRENGMDPGSITLTKYGQLMHLAPDGTEGFELTAEEVYGMLPAGKARGGPRAQSGKGGGEGGKNAAKGGGPGRPGQPRPGGAKEAGAQWDDHSRWGQNGPENDENDKAAEKLWARRVMDACEAISVRDPSGSRGLLPAFARRLLEEWKKPQTDWRTILSEFVQEEVVDYSFTPPDRRFSDGPFFLPDLSEKEERVEDILFMIDTSASMSDGMVTAAFSEVKGAIDQFEGKLRGWLGFFDAAVIPPRPFESVEELRTIRPQGGGGTSFEVIFDHLDTWMEERPPASIIILTDGHAPFPDEGRARGVPVLWLLNNETVQPPWGRTARLVR